MTVALKSRSQQLVDLPIRLTKLPHWDMELGINVGLRALRGAHLVYENTLVLANALEAGGDVGTLEVATQVGHIIGLGERVK